MVQGNPDDPQRALAVDGSELAYPALHYHHILKLMN